MKINGSLLPLTSSSSFHESEKLYDEAVMHINKAIRENKQVFINNK